MRDFLRQSPGSFPSGRGIDAFLRNHMFFLHLCRIASSVALRRAVRMYVRPSTMATIEILGWKENHIGWTGWDSHAKTELTKRLRRAISTSPQELRRLSRQIQSRNLVVIHEIHEENLESLRQILETLGANVSVSFPGKK